jgi:hypothetical protein
MPGIPNATGLTRPAPMRSPPHTPPARQLLKGLAQRDDGGRALAGGLDVAEWLAMPHGGDVAGLAVGLLSSLRPAVAPHQRAASAAAPPAPAAATDAAGASTSAAVTGSPSPSAAAAAAKAGVRGPAKPPYPGYRGDVAGVIANAAFRRPAVAAQLVRPTGAGAGRALGARPRCMP